MSQNQSQGSYMKEAVSLLGATVPLLGLNAAVYAGFFLVAVIWFAIWGAIAFFVSKLVPIAGVICILFAMGAGGFAWRMARRYLLYMVKGAHIAAMTEVMLGREVPKGPGQIQYARDIVTKYFKDVSVLFGLDALINGTVKAFTNTFVRIINFIPLPGDFRKLIRVVQGIINRSLSYVDEAILSYAIAQREENVWNSARHGIVLYGQSYKPILFTTLKAWVLGKVFGVIFFAMIIVPGLLISSLLGPEWGTLGFIIALVLAAVGGRLLELAFYEPFALAYTIVTYHREIAGKQPDPEWDQKLQNASESFRNLIGKAKEAGLKAGDQVGLPAPAPATAATGVQEAPNPQGTNPPGGSGW
ncbi:hypothetical protein FRC98_09970 [Lujinxingia vulgaris]|uniref:Uncharacterized protein n=1 Tax=Lujinxingia vulgaris TaxID=2600176 RepID=A0A5C6XHQ9_9DELT|nr:hypothetical protein [Lujinxingia vulgaris]TXD37055.1 hypothetical protein FRC98_09970 [Lujinxingia vulgaris]